MGRTFLSVRQGVNKIADRWQRASKKFKCEKRVVELAKSYSSEFFKGCNDPLDAVFSYEGDEPEFPKSVRIILR